jgi:hypothetical protein
MKAPHRKPMGAGLVWLWHRLSPIIDGAGLASVECGRPDSPEKCRNVLNDVKDGVRKLKPR